MFDFDPTIAIGSSDAPNVTDHRPVPSAAFVVFKRAFDFVGALLLLGAMLPVSLVLLVVNPIYNRGPLFFVQARMGKNCESFRAFKFRSMLPAENVARGAFDLLEANRITPLGNLLRKSRIDELPQAINVLRGEMSLIGPRPDYFDHACIYLDQVPGYRERHCVRPGITGLAQTEIGYAEGIETVRKKVAADLAYIHNRSIKLDLWITLRTIKVMVLRQGT